MAMLRKTFGSMRTQSEIGTMRLGCIIGTQTQTVPSVNPLMASHSRERHLQESLLRRRKTPCKIGQLDSTTLLVYLIMLNLSSSNIPPGATVFGDMWKDPDNPDFSQNKEFPVGTCVFKILLNNSTPEQMPIQDGAPTMHAVISKSTSNGKERNDFASPLRLIQVDFAVVDKRSPIGWVFGTFMYNKDEPGKGPWDRLTLVGLQWGNDHWLTNKVYEETKAVAKPRECYINPKAEKIRIREGGTRPTWGWNGRMNGPADNFISACASCHSTSTSHPMYNGKVKNGVKQTYGMVPPLTMAASPQPKPGNTFSDVMIYFRNVMGGVPFDEGVNPKNPDEYDPSYKSKVKSADYSLQLQVGWANYKKWKEDHETLVQSVFRKTRYVIGSELAGASDLSQRDQGRQEPTDDGPVE
ncbi:hypothetical protein FOZG_15339 [Fusarium oxysporum Fo47]|uniref:Cytochrome c domain-containing protein n=1 Tax=Fusarium oxysporum Fo47 TaxID=660027 RepID=W9JK82_FUSOX|nr:hypothetical protein FOZG_15339 [Fusarium oxysporum Fo47]